MRGESSPSKGLPGDHWSDMTSRWVHVGRPLKPTPDDIEVFERFAACTTRKAGRELEALLLGVTPEIVSCNWPQGTHLTAVDSSRSMINAFWPAPGARAACRAICADWRKMPLRSRTIDLVLGDGCNAALPFTDGVSEMIREVARVLRPEGLFLLRSFVRPEPAETVEDVTRDLAAGRIGSVHVLKWRLFAALCEDIEIGVRLGDVWDVWNGIRDIAAPYSPTPGWSAAEIGTIEIYRGDIETRFYFPSLAQLRALMSQHFANQRCIYGEYELADRCPIMILTKAASL
jgi:SAM-dependent methyltransferase